MTVMYRVRLEFRVYESFVCSIGEFLAALLVILTSESQPPDEKCIESIMNWNERCRIKFYVL